MNKEIFKNINYETSPVSALYSLDLKLNDDKLNEQTETYTKDIFSSFETFNFTPTYDENTDISEDSDEALEKQKKRENDEKFTKNYEKLLSEINSLSESIKKDTYKLKHDMESDNAKRAALEKEEKERIEAEKEKMKKKMEEEKKKAELERKEKEKRNMLLLNSIDKQITERRNNNRSGRLIVSGSVKERLIKAGNNYENIRKKYEDIANDRNISNLTNKLLQEGNEKINQLNFPEDIIKIGDGFIKLFKEIKERRDNSHELYLFLSYVIVYKIFDKLDSNNDYLNYYLFGKLMLKINSKTLNYLFMQRCSYYCPYIIPVIYSEKDFPNTALLKKRQGFQQDDKDLKEINKRLTNYEYMYFTYVYLEIIENKNNDMIKIIEDYVNNLEKFHVNNINYLISGSFICFMNVFGNFIKIKSRELFSRVEKIKKNVLEGISNEKKTNKNNIVKGFDDAYKNKIIGIFNLISNNRNTKFIDEINNNHN